MQRNRAETLLVAILVIILVGLDLRFDPHHDPRRHELATIHVSGCSGTY